MPIKRMSGYAHVDIRVFDIDELEEAPYNPRSITSRAEKALGESIEQFGLLALPVVNVMNVTPRIVSGHKRIKYLKGLGIKRVQCIAVKLTLLQEKGANVALNNPHIQGEFVPDMVKQLVNELLAVPDFAPVVRRMNTDALIADLNKRISSPVGDVVAPEDGAAREVDEVPARPKRQVSKPGEIYQVGRSFLMCGGFDSATVQGYIGQAQSLFNHGIIAEEAIVPCTEGSVLTAADSLDVDAALEWWGKSKALKLHRLCCLHRDSSQYRNDARFSLASVLVGYGWVAGRKHVYLGGDSTPNTCRIVSEGVGYDVFSWALRLFVEEHNWMVVTSTASGAELVAAHDARRRVFSFAHTPVQCDIARQRWAKYTGEKAWDKATPIYQ